jgi:8-oxo-dGTP diphosphatase
MADIKLTLVVACALIDADKRVLLAQRPEGKALAGLWEFPGGKIDPDESHHAALKRELREELDADIEVGELTFATTHPYPDRNVALYFYRCTLRGSARPLLGQEMRWVARPELPLLDFPPADAQLIERLTKLDVR